VVLTTESVGFTEKKASRRTAKRQKRLIGVFKITIRQAQARLMSIFVRGSRL